MEKEESINHFLNAVNARSIEDLDCNLLAHLYDFAFNDTSASAVTICEESDTEEREDFRIALLNAMKGLAGIVLFNSNAEGVRSQKNKEYFDFYTRHTDWYEVTSLT